MLKTFYLNWIKQRLRLALEQNNGGFIRVVVNSKTEKTPIERHVDQVDELGIHYFVGEFRETFCYKWAGIKGVKIIQHTPEHRVANAAYQAKRDVFVHELRFNELILRNYPNRRIHVHTDSKGRAWYQNSRSNLIVNAKYFTVVLFRDRTSEDGPHPVLWFCVNSKHGPFDWDFDNTMQPDPTYNPQWEPKKHTPNYLEEPFFTVTPVDIHQEPVKAWWEPEIGYTEISPSGFVSQRYASLEIKPDFVPLYNADREECFRLDIETVRNIIQDQLTRPGYKVELDYVDFPEKYAMGVRHNDFLRCVIQGELEGTFHLTGCILLSSVFGKTHTHHILKEVSIAFNDEADTQVFACLVSNRYPRKPLTEGELTLFGERIKALFNAVTDKPITVRFG